MSILSVCRPNRLYTENPSINTFYGNKLKMQPRSRVPEDIARFKTVCNVYKTYGNIPTSIYCSFNGKARTTSFQGSRKHVQTLCQFAVSGSPLESVENPPMNSMKERKVVPDSDPPSTLDVDNLYDFLDKSTKLVVLTGAGISAESGIPDYRGANGAYSVGFKPILHKEFILSSSARSWYWALSYAGWKTLNEAKPGVAHTALASLEKAIHISLLITQNIDGLHHRARSSPLELHGTINTVACVGCGFSIPMQTFQDQLKSLNPKWAATIESVDYDRNSDKHFGMKWRQDDDISISEGFVIPSCLKCSGILKPDVVFFGDNIPKDRAAIAMQAAIGCDAFLILGSSLKANFAFRLARVAFENGAAIAIINIGETRADAFAHLKIQARVGEILPRVLNTGSLSVPAISDANYYDTKYMAGN